MWAIQRVRLPVGQRIYRFGSSTSPDLVLTAAAGGGSVVASVTDPAVRPTGGLGLSTVVSWTLGTEAGTNNNQLRATATGPSITGNPITFTASGIIPAGQGIFKGLLKRITNAGFVDPPEPIGNASLTFVDVVTKQPLGTAKSRGDGTFTSPPLPVANPYQINVEATDFKAISFAKPALSSGGTFSLGPLGMVPFSDAQGTALVGFSVKLSDVPANSVKVHVFVFSGYFVGEVDDFTDPKLIKQSEDVDTDPLTGRVDVIFDPVGDC